ncbi:hypothetical protein I307_05080 [Cryptococcus deuterogattii 99/473]|uniref:Right handed beta helix domain-containing protein n=1 Tax=Cryptococcus deuterogattii Ram5 TaxID=1296110 RepID=A0A0D0VDG2_9TREE|nr:hypothetical protein I313_01120 [Cryptococcus deuterogattii Ram5]KIY55491.1 hypothetical protein I307_05080 [Cryptococcus deuterogattii 99/473]
MIPAFSTLSFLILIFPFFVSAACTDNSTDTAGLQKLLTDGSDGYKLQLCQNQIYSLTDVLNYTASNQEISTEGYPTGDARAVLVVAGFNQSTAVSASGTTQDSAALRHIIINGNRAANESIYKGGGGNIEFGGANSNQVIEYVKSYNPRGWSCMHISEGQLNCLNATVQYNDIGPCGTDYFQNWADGISLSCSASLVQNNEITDATDGGIVVFGAPFSTVRNNTIKAKTRVMIGGINMVDVKPWKPIGNYSHTVVEGNTIYGGLVPVILTTSQMGNETRGPQEYQAMIKIGLALGPDAWFSDQRFGSNKSFGGVIQDNRFSGAFAFGMGITSAKDFIIQNNTFFGNTSFIGNYGPNCTTGDKTPHPSDPLLEEESTLQNTTISVPASSPFQFVNGTAIGLTCFVPPESASYSWPYGDGQVNSEQTDKGNGTSGISTSTSSASQTSMASTGSPNRNKSPAKRVTDLPGVKCLLLAIAWAMSQSITRDFIGVI